MFGDRRISLAFVLALLPSVVAAQELPMTREGLDSALAQYFAGADDDHDGRLDRAETAEALGYARTLMTAPRDDEPFVMDVGPDGRPRLTLNEKGPLGQGGLLDVVFRICDSNSDGALALAEVQAAGRRAFDTADKDKDGILDDQERQAAFETLKLFKGVLSGAK
ncbi:MAG: hypothetical protein EON94_08150 [Caulobacteraceae bacterium]|nr:MAG: hypothetical protein EON94_08150 [Caulobacteraceae bacterium]